MFASVRFHIAAPCKTVDYYAKILSYDWLRLSNYVFAFVLARAVWTAPWRALWRNNVQFNAMIGLTLWLGVLWLLPVGVRDGLKLHPLGATLCFLMFDWEIASLMLSILLVVSLLYNGASLIALGSIGLVMIVLPVMATRLFFRLFQRFGKKNYFSFILWNGYFCGILTMLLVGLCNGLLVVAFGTYSWFTIKNVYLAFLPVISFTESFLTGAFISGFAAFLPNAVAHFDPDIYFAKKPPD